ncbi:DUF3137 domain-containing protein [Chitinophaga sp. RCC_12]|uniref:DUF3137 domain-containing protein n=1 Tax=Chitinophaga sp. RCC_12 TaxID=3239226 RepID=UPI003525EACA
MKTLEEFNAFLDRQLNDELESLEKQRIAGRNWVRRMWVVSLVPFVVFVFFIVRFSLQPASGNEANRTFVIAGLVLLVTLTGYAMRRFMIKRGGVNEATDYRHDFKHRIVKPLISFIHPDYQYQPLNHASYEEFTESGLFEKKAYQMTGNDQVYGKLGEMNFQFCDLTVMHMPLVTVRGQGPDTVFCGSYFIGQFPRCFSTPVYVLSRNGAAGDGYIQTWHLGKKVLPADAAFNKLFMVYAPDEVAAQQLLTPALMERIVALHERTGARLFISFYNNRVYIGIDHGTDYFETTLNKSLHNRQLLNNFFLDFMSMLQLAEDLKSNLPIWTSRAFSPS